MQPQTDPRLTHLTQLLPNRTPDLMDARGRYAVLVPLVPRREGLHLLYEVRAKSLRRQPGEVCFPGGHIEAGESPTHCALREASEELGLSPASFRPLGTLDFLIHRSNFILYPILAVLEPEDADALCPNPAEVDEVFLAPVDYLLAHPPQEYRYTLEPNTPENFPYELVGIPRNYPWQKGGEIVPVYTFGNHAIWGMTGRITRHLLGLLAPEGPDSARRG